MNFLNRAWLYVIRKRKKSFIIFSMLFIAITLILIGTNISSNVTTSKNEWINISNKSFKISAIKPGVNNFSIDFIEDIKAIKGINDYNASIDDNVIIKNIKKVEADNNLIQYDDELYKNLLSISGNENSEVNINFMNGSIKLIEGKHIKNTDTNKILINKSFAELNNYKIGDEIILNSPDENKSINVEIIGIFDISDDFKNKDVSPDSMIENLIISDNNSVAQLNGYENKEMGYNSVVFYINNSKDLDNIVSNVAMLPSYSSNLNITKGEDLNKDLMYIFENIESLIKLFILGMVLVSLVVLSLILVFWIQSRVHEVGVLLSIGVSKLNILCQFIFELLLI